MASWSFHYSMSLYIEFLIRVCCCILCWLHRVTQLVELSSVFSSCRSLAVFSAWKPFFMHRVPVCFSFPFFFSQVQLVSPALSFSFRGSFAASSRVPSFFLCPPSPFYSLPSHPPQSCSTTSTPTWGSYRGGKFKLRLGFYTIPAFFHSSTSLFKGEFWKDGKLK